MDCIAHMLDCLVNTWIDFLAFLFFGIQDLKLGSLGIDAIGDDDLSHVYLIKHF